MNGEAKDGALNTVTNVGQSAMRVFSVPYATAASYLAQASDSPCDERLADIADGHQLPSQEYRTFAIEGTIRCWRRALEHAPGRSATWPANGRAPGAGRLA